MSTFFHNTHRWEETDDRSNYYLVLAARSASSYLTLWTSELCSGYSWDCPRFIYSLCSVRIGQPTGPGFVEPDYSSWSEGRAGRPEPLPIHLLVMNAILFLKTTLIFWYLLSSSPAVDCCSRVVDSLLGNVNKLSFPKDGVRYVLGIWMVSGAVPYYCSEYWSTVLVIVVPIVCKTDDSSMERPTS